MDTKPTNEEIEQQWPGFTVTCNTCGSRRVLLDNSMGFSAMSGTWGSIDLSCLDCEASTVIVDS